MLYYCSLLTIVAVDQPHAVPEPTYYDTLSEMHSLEYTPERINPTMLNSVIEAIIGEPNTTYVTAVVGMSYLYSS